MPVSSPPSSAPAGQAHPGRTRPQAHGPRPGVRRSRGPGRVRALDGLRGVAVLAVLVFHAWPTFLPGGFVGVDVFFVLSGFLITTGLVRSVDAGAGAGLRSFWMRRIRRLVPAMVLALVGGTALAWITALASTDFPARLGRQWLGALTYTSNWLMIVDGSDYFGAAAPPLFEHLWSLAIEEQFYLLWPLLIVGLLALFWPREATRASAARADTRRVWTVLALAAASAVWMAGGALAGLPHTRLYFGTDTHAFGLLLGAAVALWLTHARRPEDGGPVLPTPPVRTALAWALFAVLLVGFVRLDGTREATYRGALAGLSLVVTLVLVHVVQGSRQDSLSRFLSNDVLRWWGRRSYAAYLWHWPLLVLLRVVVPPTAAAWIEPVAAGAVLLLTAVIADLSTRFLEEPILRHGFRGAAAGWARAARGAPRSWGGRLAVGGAALALVGVPTAAVAAVVHSPDETALEREISAAQSAIEEARRAQDEAAAARPTPTPSPSSPSPSPSPSASGASASPSASSTSAKASPTASATPDAERPLGLGDPAVTRPAFTAAQLAEELPPSTLGPRVTVLGDSVALSAAPALLREMPGVTVDAEVGRQLEAAAGRLEGMRASGTLTDVVVLALGANGTADSSHWDRIRAAVGPERLLVLVVPHGPDPWIQDVQERMAVEEQRHPDRLVLADWEAASPYVSGWAPDGVHPRGNGQAVYAQLIRLTIEERLGLR